MNQYQLTLLVKQDVSDKDRDALFADITKKVSKVHKQDLWGARDMVYPIDHQKKAFYAHFEFEAAPDQVPNLDKDLKLNEDILRYLLLRNEK